MAVQTIDLWSLVRGRPQIDPTDLAEAVASQVAEAPLDYRTRLLIRDSMQALGGYWGKPKLNSWLASCPTRQKIAAICDEEFEEVGFPSIRMRLMEKTDPDTVRLYFTELARHVRKPLRLEVGGAIALILPQMIVRYTEDIDVVDEVPRELRNEHDALDNLQKRYGLHLGHFQQHYLPTGWADRLHYYDSFDDLHVYLVDHYDVFLSKLTSIREKDFDDMRVLKPQLDKAVLAQRLKDTMQSAFASKDLKERAQNNWKTLFGEDLPQ
ncbi:MAG: hypothetical protein HY289_04940 [Planctomycetes bacterium]|nr:hypothetical protein [Planctomycetota bacterium]